MAIDALRKHFSPDSLLSILPLYRADRYGIILRRSIDVDCPA
ncbi:MULTISPECIES: hypothetical protein [unclassified Undibacterium]|nr:MULTISPECIES: hypothetical protein [unclassified Undibacterium]MEB0137573.1 hypothetical protein [Undibacterium sp. CCC2.1]MEB0170574.1 hypothetical protein [Undibacterium sp. CCC1.1]MEB0174515.1 hypothetical protein [Undibacterium sp. CCC3.4]MEB0213688.1 hypothetical protein [Undibacterium sp. 5I2]WPX43853.1 hypothetical protein RHM61_01060 [Undibacterium sp. CCC3.4]